MHGKFKAENVQDLCQVTKWNSDQECPLKALFVQNLVPGPHATGKLYRHKGLEVGVVLTTGGIPSGVLLALLSSSSCLSLMT